MGFLNNDGQFTDESLSLLIRDLRGFITVCNDRYGCESRPYEIHISEPKLNLECLPENEHICEKCPDGCKHNGICWDKAKANAENLLKELTSLL